METLNRDEILKIMSLLDEKSFLQYCSTNKYYYTLCGDKNLLYKRLYNFYPNDFDLYKKVNNISNDKDITDWNKIYKEVLSLKMMMNKWKQEMLDEEDDEKLAILCDRNIYTKYICKNDDDLWKQRIDKHYPNNPFSIMQNFYNMPMPPNLTWRIIYASTHRVPAGSRLSIILQEK